MDNILDLSAELLAKKIDKEFNILKVIEECAELQEVLTKTLTKKGDFKPRIEKVIEEAGDVMFRIVVLSHALDITKEIQDRIEIKAKVMYDWANEKFKPN